MVISTSKLGVLSALLQLTLFSFYILWMKTKSEKYTSNELTFLLCIKDWALCWELSQRHTLLCKVAKNDFGFWFFYVKLLGIKIQVFILQNTFYLYFLKNVSIQNFVLNNKLFTFNCTESSEWTWLVRIIN